jgi:hypothetical protein
MAEAEAKRIRLVAAADTERMTAEAGLLRQNPLLINKIIAERLSDKLQLMMVPSDSKIFFNDVMHGTSVTPQVMSGQQALAESQEGDDPSVPGSGGSAYQARRR